MTKRYFNIILLITFIAVTFPVRAQEPPDMQGDNKSTERQWCISLGGGMGGGVFRDFGTAPISFKGIALQPYIGVQMNGTRWKMDIECITNVGVFEDAVKPKLNFGSFDINNTFRLKFSKEVTSLFEGTTKTDGCLSAGIASTNFFDVTVNTAYENSAAGVSEFFGPEVSMRADIIFLSSRKLHGKMKIYGEMGFMPIAAVLRPGYAYIDNYTARHPVLSALFDDFQWNLTPLAGLYTDIGVQLPVGCVNHISISYLWYYHTTWNSGYWRFDHATHMLRLCLDFGIKGF